MTPAGLEEPNHHSWDVENEETCAQKRDPIVTIGPASSATADPASRLVMATCPRRVIG